MTRKIAKGVAATLLSALGVLQISPVFAEPWVSEHYTDHPLAGTAWSAAGEPVSRAEIERRAAAAQFVLLGEIHDNPDHHRLQADLLEAMVAAGRKPALVFEMIPAGYQQALDAFVAEAPVSAAGLGPLVAWQERGWPDWSIYQPIAEVALGAGLSIIAGDLDRDTIRSIGRKGRAAIPADEQARLSLSGDLPEPLDLEIRQILKKSHCNLLPDPAIGPMLLVQRARDGAMAAAMLAAGERSADGAVLIAGSGHVRRDFAVPRLLAEKTSASSVFAVAFVEVEPDGLKPADYDLGELYDIVMFTPRYDLTDHCAELAESMKNRPVPQAE